MYLVHCYVSSIKNAWCTVKSQSVIINVVHSHFDVQIIIPNSNMHIIYWKTQIGMHNLVIMVYYFFGSQYIEILQHF